MEMKQVRYFKPTRTPEDIEVLYEEDYRGVHIVIVNLGKYPTAYCSNIVNLQTSSDSWEWDVHPHGGVTYVGCDYWGEDKAPYIGWDYGHAGDFDGYDIDEIQIAWHGGECHKWTTEEILEDAHQFVDFLITKPLW